MNTAIKTASLTLLLALGTLAPAVAPAFLPALGSAAHAEGAAPEPAVKRPDLKKVGQHLRDHQQYPASRAELLASCKGLSDFSAGEKRWFADHLPEGTYQSADEVLKALGR